jgi:hypothetical protein
MQLDIPQVTMDEDNNKEVNFVSLCLPSRVLSKQYRRFSRLYEASEAAECGDYSEHEWLDVDTLLYKGLIYECGEA